MTEVNLDFSNCFEIDDEDELHLWLPKPMAQDYARKLVNKNVAFTYLPEPGNEGSVEVICDMEDVKGVLKLKVMV